MDSESRPKGGEKSPLVDLLGRVREIYRPIAYIVAATIWIGLTIGLIALLGSIIIHRKSSSDPIIVVTFVGLNFLLLPLYIAISIGGASKEARSSQERRSGLRYGFGVAAAMALVGTILWKAGGLFGTGVCSIMFAIFASIGFSWLKTPTTLMDKSAESSSATMIRDESKDDGR
jgi:hypothetical protein